ncbi:MAG: TIGR01777 family oxidoreductase [Actinomycetota bacterium]|nr:TIGR01777 family oxidoreductase [Actinomycetota bacterium]
MKLTVTGATGTIGRALVGALLERGDSVTVLSRRPDRAKSALGDVRALAWSDPKSEPPPPEALEAHDGIVHLLGEPVAQRWSKRAKREIRESRVLATRQLVAGLRAAERRPGVLVSQSATGWYGARGDEPLDESAPPADDFLAQVVSEWEAEARRAEDLGVRVAITRTGVVLSQSGGALEKMLPPFRLGVGGPVAGGRQYVPWVHADDVVGALIFCLENPAARGPVNVTAPEPVTNRELSKALGRVLGRPALAPVPALALRALYGEMASIVTTGARVLPRRLEELGYGFRQPDLDPALRAAAASRGAQAGAS